MGRPETIAERSGYRATSTHAEVMSFIAELEALGSPLLHTTTFGSSPQGRALPLLVLSSAGIRDAAAAKALGRPVVLLQNCIHAGEVEGKEAALMLVRDLLGGLDEGLLDRVTVLVVPIFNPDGNDAMDTENRALHIERLIGQDGPPKVGTRVNAAGINLNRDYIQQRAPEMLAMQTAIQHPYEPDLTIDSHATNGSVHRFAMTYDIPHTVESGRREPIEFMRQTLVPEIAAAVRGNFGFESGWYGNFVEDEQMLELSGAVDPAASVREGWMTYPHHPRFGSNYRGLTNRLDLLLECYSYSTYEERVRTTYAWLLEALRAVARAPERVTEVVAASRRPPDRVAVGYELKAMDEPFEVLTRSPRTRSGEPSSVRVPLLARFVGSVVVDRPYGYVVPARLSSFLRGHGLRVESAPARANVEVPYFAGSTVAKGRAILEASGHGVRQVAWKTEPRRFAEDSVFVPTQQPLGALAVYLCEPESDDGLVENALVPVPAEGEAFEVVRVRDAP